MAQSKKAVIAGAGGQDGTLLGALLRSRGYRLVCVDRGVVDGRDLGWDRLVDITSAEDVRSLVTEVRPDEIYHLAAVHHSAEERPDGELELFRASYEVNFFSLLNFLEAVRAGSMGTRVFYAASSHVYAESADTGSAERQTEESPLSPQSVYAMTKVDGLLAARHYRSRHGVFASVGILYNHESKHRPPTFLSKKVARAVAEIKRGKRDRLVVADLSARVDWGYAPDYVEAMHAILQAPAPDEFIVATGVAHTVRDFIAIAFEAAGLEWENFVVESDSSPARRSGGRVGDASKLTGVTGWRPKTGFAEMVQILVREELQDSNHEN